jgi:hypothetical protein
MIISKIAGGLGNQMFQYAFGRHLSNKLNTDYRQEISFYDNQGVVVRQFALNKFKNTKINLDLKNISEQIYLVNEPQSFQNINLDPKFGYFIDGYWQNENYFIETEDIIRQDFAIDEELKNSLYQKYPELTYRTISLHVRRSDYIHMGKNKDVSNEYFIIQPIEYYEKALEIIDEYDYLFIISDDIEWCKNNLRFNNMIFIESNDDIVDLYIMSLCKHNINANSSFSWWSAWLNNNKDKKVVAPINWFGPKIPGNSLNIIPESWIKI